MTDQAQHTEAPASDPTPGPSSAPYLTASTSHPPSPSMQDSTAGSHSPEARPSPPRSPDPIPPSMLTRPPKGSNDLRDDYGTIHGLIHRAQQNMYERDHNPMPVLDVIVGSHHLLRYYLPPHQPAVYALDDYRTLLSMALRNVRAAFLERQAEEKEASKKKALEIEALKKEALGKSREEQRARRKLSGGDDECKPGGVDSARRQSKRKAEEAPEASEDESSGRDGERTKRRKIW